MQDFRNLVVWRAARQLTRSVYQISARFPQTEEFGLKAQMRRAAVSICSNLAEGCGRRGDREFRRFVAIAMGSACELECELIIAFDLALHSKSVLDPALAAVIDVKRMLAGLMNRLTPASKV